MATSKDFIEFVYDQISSAGNITYKKMFGEYMVYYDGKPVLLVCDDTVFIKQIPAVIQKFNEYNIVPEPGFPYNGAKEHFILDIDNSDLSIDMTRMLYNVLPAPKPKKPKIKNENN